MNEQKNSEKNKNQNSSMLGSDMDELCMIAKLVHADVRFEFYNGQPVRTIIRTTGEDGLQVTLAAFGKDYTESIRNALDAVKKRLKLVF